MIKENEILNKKYKIIETIAQGGTSNIFLAIDLKRNKTVAIKILNEQSSARIENLIRFKNEAEIIKHLHHKYIIKFIESGEYKETFYIVTEYIKCNTLRNFLDLKRFLSLDESIAIMLEILDGVEYIHSKKIVHRDLKPLNIFYNSDGGIKISDFGISFFLEGNTNINENSKVQGTVQYLAPEIIKGYKPSFQSDIYALGIVFYELLTGKVPFDNIDFKKVSIMQINNKIPSVLKVFPKTNKDVDIIIAKATNKNISKRYKTVANFKEDLIKLKNKEKITSIKTNLFDRIFGLFKE